MWVMRVGKRWALSVRLYLSDQYHHMLSSRYLVLAHLCLQHPAMINGHCPYSSVAIGVVTANKWCEKHRKSEIPVIFICLIPMDCELGIDDG